MLCGEYCGGNWEVNLFFCKALGNLRDIRKISIVRGLG